MVDRLCGTCKWDRRRPVACTSCYNDDNRLYGKWARPKWEVDEEHKEEYEQECEQQRIEKKAW